MPVATVISSPTRMGGTIGLKNNGVNCADDSLVYTHLYVAIDKQEASLADKQPPMVKLYNTRCKYYSSFEGCKRGWQCFFLHDEAPLKAVFYDGAEIVRYRTSDNKTLCEICESEEDHHVMTPIITKKKNDGWITPRARVKKVMVNDHDDEVSRLCLSGAAGSTSSVISPNSVVTFHSSNPWRDTSVLLSRLKK